MILPPDLEERGMTPERVLLVAGGTGGHILPAVAFGEWLCRRDEHVDVRYLSGCRALELEIYRSMGVEPEALPLEGSPLGVSPLRGICRWGNLFRSFGRTRRVLEKMRAELCVLFGGYVSFPALAVGRWMGIPMVAHEQNAAAGRVTRLAIRIGVPVAAGWESCYPLAAGEYRVTGVPIRRFENMERMKAWQRLGLEGSPPPGGIVVVMTGSLGSEGVLTLIREVAGDTALRGRRFLFLAPGAKEPEMLTENLTLLPMRWDIAPLYNLADLMIVRGGASTLSEIRATGIPAVVIPWRGAADDHQARNAAALENCSDVAVWFEGEQKSEFIRKISKMSATSGGIERDISKKMYNIAEKTCERLWDYASGRMKGEIAVGGKKGLH